VRRPVFRPLQQSGGKGCSDSERYECDDGPAQALKNSDSVGRESAEGEADEPEAESALGDARPNENERFSCDFYHHGQPPEKRHAPLDIPDPQAIPWPAVTKPGEQFAVLVESESTDYLKQCKLMGHAGTGVQAAGMEVVDDLLVLRGHSLADMTKAELVEHLKQEMPLEMKFACTGGVAEDHATFEEEEGAAAPRPPWCSAPATVFAAGAVASEQTPLPSPWRAACAAREREEGAGPGTADIMRDVEALGLLPPEGVREEPEQPWQEALCAAQGFADLVAWSNLEAGGDSEWTPEATPEALPGAGVNSPGGCTFTEQGRRRFQPRERSRPPRVCPGEDCELLGQDEANEATALLESLLAAPAARGRGVDASVFT